MVYQDYRKDEIAARMLDTALDLCFRGGDGFSIIHLAAAAEEVLAGLIKDKKNKTNSQVPTAREKTILALQEIHGIHGNKRTEEEIGTYLNFIRNKTKHHNTESDSIELSVCLELEVQGAIFRAIENYVQYFGNPTEKMVRYQNHHVSHARVPNNRQDRP